MCVYSFVVLTEEYILPGILQVDQNKPFKKSKINATYMHYDYDSSNKNSAN